MMGGYLRVAWLATIILIGRFHRIEGWVMAPW